MSRSIPYEYRLLDLTNFNLDSGDILCHYQCRRNHSIVATMTPLQLLSLKFSRANCLKIGKRFPENL